MSIFLTEYKRKRLQKTKDFKNARFRAAEKLTGCHGSASKSRSRNGVIFDQ